MSVKHLPYYRVCVLSFILVFSFFHVGYAAIEYICSMGMEMKTPLCAECHPDDGKFANEVSLTISESSPCCTVVVTETRTIGTYMITPVDIHNFIEYAAAVVIVPVTPKENSAIPYYFPELPYIPIFNLHGINTSLQYSSSLI
jgi:hypothetical protein